MFAFIIIDNNANSAKRIPQIIDKIKMFAQFRQKKYKICLNGKHM